MQRTLLVVLFLSASLLLTGCGDQQSTSITPPTQQKTEKTTPKNETAVVPTGQQASQNVLENTAPSTTNDLPTAIKETETDLQVIEKDLQEIEQMDLSEETIEL